jgi:predicted alpha-1,2-mannosidase
MNTSRNSCLIFLFALFAVITCFGQNKTTLKKAINQPSKNMLVDYVDTKIGVIGTRASNCVLGPQMPFGCINPSPQSAKGSTPGYNPRMPTKGYGQLHVSGTGGDSRYGHFLVSPQTGIAVGKNDHDSPAKNEVTRAYYFKSILERYNITTEIAPTQHSAIYRFTFQKSDSASIIIDASQSVPKDIIGAKNVKILENSIQIDKQKGTIRGMIYTMGGWGCVSPYKFFFVAAFNKPLLDAGVWKNTTLLRNDSFVKRETPDELAEERIGTYCRFKTTDGEQIEMKVAVSLSSYENAEKFLQAEIPHWDLEQIKTAGMNTWEKQLEKIRVDAPTEAQKKLFYTAMYHTMVMPRNCTGDNPYWSDGKPFWDDQYAIWDTWRTLYPLQLLINPDMVRDNILSFIDRLKHNGMVRDAFVSGSEGSADQGGNNVDNIIADAYVKGVKGIDWNEAYGVMKFNADHERLGGGFKSVPGYNPDIYRKQGWIPNGDISTSYTLEYAYNDFCAATVAKGLHKNDDYHKYLDRSNGWVNLWDENAESKGYKGFIGVKDWDNKFLAFDPAFEARSWKGPFYEGTSWTYSYFVPHNIPKLVSLMGGKEKFIERLDFALKNNLIDYGNEPSFLALRSFSHVGRPDLTSYWVHYALNKNFDLTGGLGNDDSGAMSSWYIFSALGFFPNAGQDIYYLNAPLYPKSVITLGNGKKLTILAENASEKNIYIKSCKINGKIWNNSIFHHRDIANGGTIELVLTDKPTDWAKN